MVPGVPWILGFKGVGQKKLKTQSHMSLVQHSNCLPYLLYLSYTCLVGLMAL